MIFFRRATVIEDTKFGQGTIFAFGENIGAGSCWCELINCGCPDCNSQASTHSVETSLLLTGTQAG